MWSIFEVKCVKVVFFSIIQDFVDARKAFDGPVLLEPKIRLTISVCVFGSCTPSLLFVY